MAAKDALSRAHAARVAAITRHRGVNDPDLPNVRRDLRAARLEDAIRRAVAEAPPLTPEQRDRLAVLLRAGAPPGQVPARTSGGTTSAETGSQVCPGDAA